MSNKYVQLHKIHSLSQCSIWNQVIVVYFTLNTKFQRTVAVPTPLPAFSLVSVSDSCSVVSDSATLWSIAHQASLSMDFSR